MYLGEIVEMGPREAVFADPQHPYTRRLLSAEPLPDPARRKMVRNLPDSELRSPLRNKDYIAPARSYREVSPGHFVQDPDTEWV
jgi:peptide/nickel transport system ATP-binding protein